MVAGLEPSMEVGHGRTRATLRSFAGSVSLMLLYFSFTNSAYAVLGRLTLAALVALSGLPSSCESTGPMSRALRMRLLSASPIAGGNQKRCDHGS